MTNGLLLAFRQLLSWILSPFFKPQCCNMLFVCSSNTILVFVFTGHWPWSQSFFFFSLFRPKLWTRQEQCYSRLVHKCLYSAWSLSFCSRSVLATQQKILQPIKFQLWTCGRFHVSFVSLLVLFTRYCCSLQFYFASFGLEKIHPCSRRVFFCVWDHWHIFVQLTLCSMYDVVLSPWYYANLCPMYNITLLHV